MTQQPQETDDDKQSATLEQLYGRYYTVKEVAELWKLSTGTVSRLFRDEPGVLHLETRGVLYKRKQVMLRIPASVLERVRKDRMVKVTRQ